MVNQVLKLYKGSNLHEFSIHYPLLENSSCHIDLWVAFAIATGVSRLELNFSFDAFWKNEIIPRRYGDESKGKTYYLLQLDRISSVLVSPLIAKNRLKSFKEIILNCVHTTDSSFETILSACSSLERLYNGPKINISLQGAQQLVNFAIYLSQLEHLMMDVSSFEGTRLINEVPHFCKLKQLSLRYFGVHPTSLCYNTATSFLKASPLLHRLELHVSFVCELQLLPKLYPTERRARGKTIPMSPHKNLKEFLLSGFEDDEANMEFMMFIFDRAICHGTGLCQRLPPKAQLKFLDN
ncbi:hypothetical protein P3X46_025915 [Hevea brasiliensis]|uniref:FBD domain-containing protein n=1 Tax=Hevea brasiliensis TaxID=3981 RepID=A0ABQ9KVT9_HEVBR|nr:hypothetical protein P3X46_025915 [Hevea brasiliensis]